MSQVNRLLKIAARCFMVLLGATPAFAQRDTATGETAAAISHLRPVGAGLAIIGVGVAIVYLGGSSVSAVARQPEAWGTIQTGMLITAALIEGAGFFALIICFMNP